MTDRIEIPAGVKLPYHPPVKVGDEVLALDYWMPDLVRKEDKRGVVTEVTDSLGWGYNDPRIHTESGGVFSSWAIVNGPVEKGDWVIALEGAADHVQPGTLQQVSHTKRFNDQPGIYTEDGWYGVTKWAKVELEDKPVSTVDEYRDFVKRTLKDNREALKALGLHLDGNPKEYKLTAVKATYGDYFIWNPDAERWHRFGGGTGYESIEKIRENYDLEVED